MMAKVDHIGIATRSIDTAGKFYAEVLGLAVAKREIAAGGLKVAFIPVGETKIELLEPGSENDNIARFLETRGEGIHHLAFAVDNVEAALAQAKAAGYTLIDEKPRQGAGGALIAFLHPKSTGGVLVEFCEHH